MSKNVIIYTRVSTDDQADFGFSLQHQETVIRAFCNTKGYNILNHYKEDFSAKTFNRPEWSKILSFLKPKRQKVDSVVFLRWDRFSRNLEESSRTIRELKSHYGVDVECVEQPLDLSIPDNLVMLAVYLAVPEVENRKNSIRTTEGSRKARLEGCWTGTAPFGYDNYRDEQNRSTLIRNLHAPLVIEAFDLMATGVYSAEEVRKRLGKKGMSKGKQTFLDLLRNVAYLGKVPVKEYKDEPAQVVAGLHLPLVDEVIFRKVQNVLKGKKPNFNFDVNRSGEYPLRQFIICPKCGRGLTASGSTGRSGNKHHYYHCMNNTCKVRHKLSDVHEDFNGYLATIKVGQNTLDLYSKILEDVFKKEDGVRLQELKKLRAQADMVNNRLKKVQDSYYDGITSPSEFRTDKVRYEKELADIRAQIDEKETEGTPFKKYIKEGFSLLGNLPHYYETSKEVEVKHKILGSIFPEKLHYLKRSFRTTQVNSVLSLLLKKTNGLQGTEKEKVGENADLSTWAPPSLVLSNQFIADLKKLSDVYKLINKANML